MAINITNATVTVGSPLVLMCSATSLANVTFKWYHPNNKALSYDGENQYYSTVIVDPVTTEDEGIYNCTAENEGGVNNATISIIVYGKLQSSYQ